MTCFTEKPESCLLGSKTLLHRSFYRSLLLIVLCLSPGLGFKLDHRLPDGLAGVTGEGRWFYNYGLRPGFKALNMEVRV